MGDHSAAIQALRDKANELNRERGGWASSTYYGLLEGALGRALDEVDALRSQLREAEGHLESRRRTEDWAARTGDPLAPPTHRSRGRVDAFNEALAALRSGRQNV